MPKVFEVTENKDFFFGRKYNSSYFEKVHRNDNTEFAETRFAVNTPNGVDMTAGNGYNLPCKGWYDNNEELRLLHRKR